MSARRGQAVGPLIVPAQDRRLRLRAAWTNVQGWVLSRTALVTTLPCIFLALAGVGALFGWRSLRSPVAVVLVVALVYACFALSTAVVTYRAAGHPDRELWFLSTGDAAAVLTLQPDRRRGQLENDWLAAQGAATPKRRGAFKTLGQAVRASVHARGGRVTGSAMPWMAAAYQRHGMYVDGRTALFMVRIASRRRPPSAC